MKSIVFKIFLLGILVGFTQVLFGQKKTDGIFLFKMWFYLEHINISSSTGNDYPVKDSSLLHLYQSVVNLKPDTLEKNGFSDDYIFLSVAPVENRAVVNDSVLSYNKTQYLTSISIPVDNCSGYVLCINSKNGKSYRLGGFLGNDFMNLLQEVKEDYLTAYHRELSTREFFKKYTVKKIDFKCMYKALSSGSVNIKKYPCLERCSNLTIMVH